MGIANVIGLLFSKDVESRRSRLAYFGLCGSVILMCIGMFLLMFASNSADETGLFVRLARRWSLRFPERGVPLNCCSSLAASFFISSLPSISSLPCAIPVPALRSCLTNTAFASSLVRSASLLRVTFPVSIIFDDGYSIFKVQRRTNIFLTFALLCITLNSYLDIAFDDFVPVHKNEI